MDRVWVAELLLLRDGDSNANFTSWVLWRKGAQCAAQQLPPQPAVVQNLPRTGYKISNSIQNNHSPVLLKQRWKKAHPTQSPLLLFLVRAETERGLSRKHIIEGRFCCFILLLSVGCWFMNSISQIHSKHIGRRKNNLYKKNYNQPSLFLGLCVGNVMIEGNSAKGQNF